MGAEYLVHLPDQYTDQHGGALTESAEIDPEQWNALVSGTNELAKYLLEEYGVKLVFHPHADTHVDTQERIERFLSDTDPDLVNLCLDTGHVAYCGGNNVEIIQRFPERITYVHLKQVDPEVRERVRREKLSLAEAVPLGVMCEPPFGEPDMPELLAALAELDRDIYCVIEQDLYPVEPHIPLPRPGPHRRLLPRLRARPGPPLAVLTAPAAHGDRRPRGAERGAAEGAARRGSRGDGGGVRRAGAGPVPGGAGARAAAPCRRGHRARHPAVPDLVLVA